MDLTLTARRPAHLGPPPQVRFSRWGGAITGSKVVNEGELKWLVARAVQLADKSDAAAAYEAQQRLLQAQASGQGDSGSRGEKQGLETGDCEGRAHDQQIGIQAFSGARFAFASWVQPGSAAARAALPPPAALLPARRARRWTR